MPIPVETFRNTRRLNVVFAVSSFAAMASMLWMLFADFQRPWRAFQTQYFDVEAALAHVEWLGFQTAESRGKHDDLKQALARAEKQIAERRGEEETMRRDAARLKGDLQAATLDYGNLKAQIQVSEFHVEENRTLHGEDDARTIHAQEVLQDEQRRLADLARRKEALEDEERVLKRRMKEFYAARDDAAKKLAAFEKGMNDARRRDELYGGRRTLFGGVLAARDAFNLPGFDFLAPKGTPGRQEIRQVVLPDIRVEMNFLHSYATDRCVTCHAAIDNPAFSRERLIETLQTALAAINEQRQAAGQPLLLPHTPTDPGRDAASQSRDREGADVASIAPPVARAPAPAQGNHDASDADLESLTAAVNEYLRSTGRAEVRYGQPLLAHPDLDLYLSANSPHPMNRMGCTVCHEGNGQETDFVLASHSPDGSRQEHEWEDKYYVRWLGLPENTLHTAHEYWERPMLLSRYTSASCAKCHTQIADLQLREAEPLPSARHIVAGRRLFTDLGCANCHAVEGLEQARQVGPDLSHVGEKLTAGFIQRWIEYPKEFRPATWMPHFFHQENNLPSSASEDDPDPILRTEAEIQAMTHYLLTFSRPYEPFEPPAGLKGDPQRGEALFTSIGCLACHANLAAKDPEDAEGRSFGRKWIVADLMHGGMEAAAAEARFAAMSANERVDYAMRRLTPERREAAQHAAEQERLAAERESRDPDPLKLYVPAAFTRFAPELSGVGTKLVPDPNDPQQPQRGRRWLYDWLREPRHYSEYTRMPRMFRDNYYWQAAADDERRVRNDQDLLDVAEYLLTLRHDSFEPRPIPFDERRAAEVRRLVTLLLVGQNTQTVAEMILNDEPLDPSDAHGMLTDRIVKAVAPSFGAGGAGVQTVLERLAGQDLAGRQMLFLGNKMINHYGCYACHQIAGFENAARPGTELTTWGRKLLAQLDFAFFAPGFAADRAAQPERFGRLFPQSAEYERLVQDTGEDPEVDVQHTHASFAYHKMRNPRLWDRAKLKRPYEKLKMPNYFLTHDEATSLVTFLLSRQQPLVSRSVQVDYDGTPLGKIARGRHLAAELNCVGCHLIEGNPANIQQYYWKRDAGSGDLALDVTNAPPNLFGQGAKIQYPWLFGFLNHVEMLRPWLTVRMPSFYLTHDETTALVEYFVGLTQAEAGSLDARLRLIRAHLGDPGGGANPTRVREEADEAEAPAAPWFTWPALKPAADWLARFALRNRLITHYDLDTSGASSPQDAAETLAAGLGKAVERASFLERLFDITYPFLPEARPASPQARYEKGRALLWELKCLACHVAGDPDAPGTTLDIKAPNFDLTHRRLRYDWVRQWLIDPQVIQPGTNMPQLFGGEQSAFRDYPPEAREAMEQAYGPDGREQIRLLVDFLYDMGHRNQTVVQPAAPPGATPSAAPPTDEFEEGSKKVEPPPAAEKPAAPPVEPEKKTRGGEDEFVP